MKKRPEKSGRRPCVSLRYVNVVDGGIHYLFHIQTIHARSYSGLNLNQDKATKPQTVQIVRQGEATPYWFKFNPL